MTHHKTDATRYQFYSSKTGTMMNYIEGFNCTIVISIPDINICTYIQAQRHAGLCGSSIWFQ